MRCTVGRGNFLAVWQAQAPGAALLLRHQYPGGEAGKTGLMICQAGMARIKPEAVVKSRGAVTADELVAACCKGLGCFFQITSLSGSPV